MTAKQILGVLPKAESLNEVFTKLKQGINKSEKAKGYLKERALEVSKLELAYNAEAYNQLKHCIVFPLKDKQNNIVSFYGRSIYNDDKAKHYYSKNRKGLYPNYPKAATKKLILTEAIIDAASLLQLEEITNDYEILSCFGTNGLTTEHTEAISQLNHLEEIIFFFDGDEAGRLAVKKHAETLQVLKPLTKLYNVETPEGEDINSLLVGHDSALFVEMLANKTFLFSIENQMKKEESIVNTTVIAQTESTLNTAKTILDCKNPDQPTYNTNELHITLLGGISLQNIDRMVSTIYMRRNPHVNASQSIRQRVDLYQDDMVEKFTRRAAEKLEMSTSIISSAIAELTEDLEGWRLAEIESKKVLKPKKQELTPKQKTSAKANLQRADLMQWTMETLLNTGIVGEAENAMILYVAMTSRLYEDPVSVICLSASGNGKSYLLERVVKCFPPEDIIENTQFTDNSFFYWKEGLKGKAIIIEDMEGAQNVEYPMRELITKKYITKTTVHKDAKGNMQTVQYRVEGPATFLGCTTKEKIYEDNANRCILIYLDGSKVQDKNIIDYHKRSRAGIVDKKDEELNRADLKNMQSILQSKKVINPYATLIDLPESVLKPRRSIGILLSFIESITLYHQYQCEIHDNAIITHPTHIEWGFRLLKESLFRKSDELSATVRSFLESIKELLKKQQQQSFYAMDIRSELKFHPRSIQRYLYELTMFGYVKIIGGNKYKKGHEYELTALATNDLRISIDKHIEGIMHKIWAGYNQRENKVSASVRQCATNGMLSHSNVVQ